VLTRIRASSVMGLCVRPAMCVLQERRLAAIRAVDDAPEVNC
jgi:hypothetical protein